jgi:hypothetical protein
MRKDLLLHLLYVFFSNVTVNDCAYQNGDLVVCEVIDIDNLSVGIVQSILIKNDQVYFVIQKYCAKRDILQFFEAKQMDDPKSTFVKSSELADFKTLIKRGTSARFLFVLHHHISFDYM